MLARAQAGDTIKIGVLNDQSGVYRDISGLTSVACVRQAVQDSGSHGFNVEVIFADHQNKPDVGSNIARQWFDRDGVDVILDVPNSAGGAGGQRRGAGEEQGLPEQHRGHRRPDRAAMQPEHGPLDLRHLDAGAQHRRRHGEGGRRYLVLHHRRLRLRPCAGTRHREFRQGADGKVLGAVQPFPGNTDFSSFLVQAQSSRAKVIGLANAGADTINA